MRFLLATTNPAKMQYYGGKLKEQGISIITLSDCDIKCSVEETGRDPVENALIKAVAYYKASHIPTIALDDGLFLEQVPDPLQPGTHVRRVQGKRLNDDEMIAHYMELVNQYGKEGKLNGYFLKGVAIVNGEEHYTFANRSFRCFTNRKSTVVHEGYPLDSIQIVPAVQKFKSELTNEEMKATTDVEYQGIFAFITETIAKMEQAHGQKK